MTPTWFDRVLQFAAAALVVMLLATVTAGVLMRGAGHPLGWSDEASGYLMVWLACFGWMIATRHRAHIRIRFFQDKLPRMPKRVTEVLIQLGLALFGAVVAWYSVHLIRTNADIEAMAMPLPVAVMYLPLLPAGLLTLVQALLDLRDTLRRDGAAPEVASA